MMNGYAAERQRVRRSRSTSSARSSATSPTRTRTTEAGRCYVYHVARPLELSSSGTRIGSDGAKLFCAHDGKEVADSAIQVLGGYGYFGEYRVERLWRDAKLLEIGGGTIEAHQKNIARDLARVGSID